MVALGRRKLAGFQPLESGVDTWVWTAGPSSLYTVKSAYSFIWGLYIRKPVTQLHRVWMRILPYKTFIALGLLVSVVLIICIMKVATAALDKALDENADIEDISGSSDALKLPVIADKSLDLQTPLVIKIDPSVHNHEK
ncbi:hypothetical protein Ancab_019447 [Ancistrocladus abbreviatus]